MSMANQKPQVRLNNRFSVIYRYVFPSLIEKPPKAILYECKLYLLREPILDKMCPDYDEAGDYITLDPV